ncbi:hypothetical protein ACU4GD_08650 [Cupriavidus basilensis]
MRRVFADHDYLLAAGDGDAPIHYSVEAGPLRLVAFDCTVPGKPGGRVDPAALPWLEATLAAEPGRPTLLMLHHPPFHTGIGHMDQQGLAGAGLLEAVVRRHPQVERVLCGHLHRHITRRFGGTVAMAAPRPAAPGHAGPRPAGRFALSHGASGYLLHWWHPAHGLVSHTAVIGAFGADHPFFDAAGKLID